MFTTARPALGPDAIDHIHRDIHEGEQCPKATNFHPIHATSGSRSCRAARCSPVLPASPAQACWPHAVTTTRSPPTRLRRQRPERRRQPTPPAGDRRTRCHRCTRRRPTAPAASGDAVSVGVYEATGKPLRGVRRRRSTPRACRTRATSSTTTASRTTSPPTWQQPDDVFTWFSGYRMRFFAEKGLTGDISDVWANLPDFSESFKAASTGNDGKQYLVPTSYYPWAIHYRKSLFEEKGYTIPTTKDELIALGHEDAGRRADPVRLRQRRQVAGAGHVRHLEPAPQRLPVPRRPAGRQGRLDRRQGQERVRDVDRAAAVPPGEPQRAHMAGSGDGAWRTRRPACSSSARSSLRTRPIRRTSTTSTSSTIPEFDAAIGADAIDAPIDGLMMAANPKNPEGAKALLTGIGQANVHRRVPGGQPELGAGQHQGRHVERSTRSRPSRPSSSARRSSSRSSSTATPAPTSCPT